MNHNLPRKTATTTVLIILKDRLITGNPLRTRSSHDRKPTAKTT